MPPTDATPIFYDGIEAELNVGELIGPGYGSNYGDPKAYHVYFSATPDANPRAKRAQ
jgi:Rifampin ADP-ribosyl transferase